MACTCGSLRYRSLLYSTYFRSPCYRTFFQKLFYCTSKASKKVTSAPLKYTTNKVSKIPISHTIGLRSERQQTKLWYEGYVVAGSISVFLIYFCILREENDIDDILRGSNAPSNTQIELLDLKMKLSYCERNKLPTDKLKARIAELEGDSSGKTSFKNF